MNPGNIGAMLDDDTGDLWIIRHADGVAITIEHLETRDKRTIYASDFWVILDSL